jgi:hypothetical protein
MSATVAPVLMERGKQVPTLQQPVSIRQADPKLPFSKAASRSSSAFNPAGQMFKVGLEQTATRATSKARKKKGLGVFRRQVLDSFGAAGRN